MADICIFLMYLNLQLSSSITKNGVNMKTKRKTISAPLVGKYLLHLFVMKAEDISREPRNS